MDRSEGEGRGHRPRTPARVGGKPCVASRRNVTPKRGAPGSRTTVSRAGRKTGRAKPGGIFGGAGNRWPSRRARSVTPKREAPGSTALTSCRLCPTVTGGSRPGPFPGGSGVVPPPRTQGAFTICVPLWVPLLRVLLRRCHFTGGTISPKSHSVKRRRQNMVSPCPRLAPAAAALRKKDAEPVGSTSFLPFETDSAQAASAWAAAIRFSVKKSVMLPSTMAVTSG